MSKLTRIGKKGTGFIQKEEIEGATILMGRNPGDKNWLIFEMKTRIQNQKTGSMENAKRFYEVQTQQEGEGILTDMELI